MNRRIAAILILAATTVLAGCASAPPLSTKAASLVDKASWTVETFKQRNDVQMDMFRDLLRDAQGVAVFPAAFKGGFIVGAEYGNGVMLARTPSGGWSYPAFYTLGGCSLGLQIGGQVAEVVLIMRSRKAVEAVVKHQGKLGADAEVSVGTIGAGMEGATTTNLGADIVVFSYAAGLYAGGSVEGSVLARRNDYNQAYYGRTVSPEAILFGQGIANPQADGLRAALTVP